MNESVIVAYVMGGFGIVIGIAFIVGFIILFKTIKRDLPKTAQYQQMMKMGEKMAKEELRKYEEKRKNK